MHRTHKILLSLLLCCATIWVSAQVVAPRLRCATSRFNGNVDLAWETPTNPCGTFNNYLIYGSASSRTGPYSLIATLNDATLTAYQHIGANSTTQTWYYYMQTDANCGTAFAYQSDTLDSQPPEPPDLQSVSVVGGQINVRWEAGVNPKIAAYIIYDANTNTPLDTIFGRTNTLFVHTAAQPAVGSRSYTIVAMDSCGNAGIVNIRPHKSIWLQAKQNRCTQSIDLQWNIYENWRKGILQQEIWVGINGGAKQVVDTVSATIMQYNLQNLRDGDNVCVEVRAVADVSRYTAASNDTCMQVSIVAPIKYVYLRNATVNPDNSVRLDWLWNNDSDMSAYSTESGSESTNLQAISRVSPIFPLTNANTISIQNEPIEKQKSYYRISATDSCNVTVRSNYATTIHLTATPDEQFNNDLEWSDYDNPYGTLQKYEVFRLVNGQLATRVANITNSRHRDTANPQYESEQDVCYYVLAYARLKFPDGSVGVAVSRSNTVCAHQNVKLHIPNAFVPDGKNNTFKPYAVFTNSVDYYMAIFDRWGGRVFETREIERGWDGTNGGQQLPQGTYTYYIKVKEAGIGKDIIKQGTLTLIR